MLKDQGGEALFTRVEAIREAAIAQREEPGCRDDDLKRLLSGLEPAAATELVRAFSTYFRVVNLAEKVHRIRRRRDYLRQEGAPQAGSLEDALLELRSGGTSSAEVDALLERLSIEPVFTAHPTESTRRVLLDKEQRLARLVIERMDPTLTLPEDLRSQARIRAEITTAWQTEEHPEMRPTVADEREHVLFFLTEILYRIVPPFYEALALARERTFGAVEERLPSLLRFASWVGGDMDGNPNVNAATVRETLRHHQQLVLRLYRREVLQLADQLSQSPSRVGVDEALVDALSDYESRFPDVVDEISPRHRDMPYRTFLRLVAHRLDVTIEQADAGYDGPDALRRDLEVVATSLEHHRGHWAGLFGVRRLLRRLATFGFHLASLDVRQDARVHREALAELLGEPDWPSRAAAERSEHLRALLEHPELRLPDDGPSPQARSTLDVFAAIADSQSRYGPRALGYYVVSMTRDTDDVLTVLALARYAGLGDSEGYVAIDVAPLFETVPDLDAAPRVLKALISDPKYRSHLERRRNRQLIMVGYSDSSKDGGMAASRWALQQAMTEMVAAVEGTGVTLSFFHGRGGTVGRGGGKTDRAVLAAPAGSVAGHLRVTEQGEVINDKYGLRGIALRELERATGATLLATAHELSEAPAVSDSWKAAITTVASSSRAHYRRLVYEEARFPELFRSVTPIDVIERLRIGSRPASRRGGGSVDNLRAIPWVFAWTQSRHLLPGWYGLGTGLATAMKRHGRSLLSEMFEAWPFVECLVADAEMALAKADMAIARHYDGLAAKEDMRLTQTIHDEYRRTVDTLLDLKGTTSLLHHDPPLKRSIRLRNPYVDPMSFLQVDLLRRWRAGGRRDPELFTALVTTVHGIAQGLQNTG